jgi:hypothetical protein
MTSAAAQIQELVCFTMGEIDCDPREGLDICEGIWQAIDRQLCRLSRHRQVDLETLTYQLSDRGGCHDLHLWMLKCAKHVPCQ